MSISASTLHPSTSFNALSWRRKHNRLASISPPNSPWGPAFLGDHVSPLDSLLASSEALGQFDSRVNNLPYRVILPRSWQLGVQAKRQIICLALGQSLNVGKALCPLTSARNNVCVALAVAGERDSADRTEWAPAVVEKEVLLDGLGVSHGWMIAGLFLGVIKRERAGKS